uniref:Uncharacterized protein n=1 Tax=Salix viminalis TaxID=40686 RepID=A0A6N2LJH3_SALVM
MPLIWRSTTKVARVGSWQHHIKGWKARMSRHNCFGSASEVNIYGRKWRGSRIFGRLSGGPAIAHHNNTGSSEQPENQRAGCIVGLEPEEGTILIVEFPVEQTPSMEGPHLQSCDSNIRIR